MCAHMRNGWRMNHQHSGFRLKRKMMMYRPRTRRNNEPEPSKVEKQSGCGAGPACLDMRMSAIQCAAHVTAIPLPAILDLSVIQRGRRLNTGALRGRGLPGRV